MEGILHMKSRLATTSLLLLTTLLYGCTQNTNSTTELSTNLITEEHTTELENTSETTTEEITTEASTEQTPAEKGSIENPYKIDDIATITTMNFSTNEKVVYELKILGWEGDNIKGELKLTESDTKTSVDVWGDTLIPYVYNENLTELTSATVWVSSIADSTFGFNELNMAVGGESTAYFIVSSYEDNVLNQTKYLVVKYFGYDGVSTAYDKQFNMDECWFELPSYGE